MVSRPDLSGLLDVAVGAAGAERVAEVLASLGRRETLDDTLTLISNGCGSFA